MFERTMLTPLMLDTFAGEHTIKHMVFHFLGPSKPSHADLASMAKHAKASHINQATRTAILEPVHLGAGPFGPGTLWPRDSGPGAIAGRGQASQAKPSQASAASLAKQAKASHTN